MKLIDATWEIRNLGVDTQEITVETGDSVEQLRDTLRSINSTYQVLKVPAGMIDMMWEAEDNGFHYMETLIHVVHDLKNIEMPEMLQRLDKSISYEIMNDGDVAILYNKIRDGMFYTDRICLDKHFTSEQATNRYIGWISDEISRGIDMYKYIYKGESVGFFSFKQIDEGVYYPFLAGIYPEFQKNVFGAVFNYKPLIEAKRRNAKLVSTYISTNNSNTVRMHVECGFKFKEASYVYVKYND